jgi:hypothetical protein
MLQFQNLKITALADALVEYSEKYYKLLATGGSERDILHCRITIHQILKEINFQKAAGQNSVSKKEKS